jgi:excisionase family DNA binding protein
MDGTGLSREELAADGAVSVAEAHAFVGLSESQFYVLMDRGEIPFVKSGRRRLVPKRALVEYLAKHMVVTG